MLARLVNEERTPPTALDVEPDPRRSRSTRTTSPTPASARWNAQLVPMTPPPTTTTSARRGISFAANAASLTLPYRHLQHDVSVRPPSIRAPSSECALVEAAQDSPGGPTVVPSGGWIRPATPDTAHRALEGGRDAPS